VTAEEALDALLLTLDQLLRMLPSSKSAWNEDDVVRLAVERLWITAGNLAEAYRLERAIAPASSRGPSSSVTEICLLMRFLVTSPRIAFTPTAPPTSIGSWVNFEQSADDYRGQHRPNR
jgi:hypothetical protein